LSARKYTVSYYIVSYCIIDGDNGGGLLTRIYKWTQDFYVYKADVTFKSLHHTNYARGNYCHAVWRYVTSNIRWLLLLSSMREPTVPPTVRNSLHKNWDK